MLFTWRRQMGAIATLPAGDAVTFVLAAITAEPAATVSPASSVVAGRMEIALASGDRVIVGGTWTPQRWHAWSRFCRGDDPDSGLTCKHLTRGARLEGGLHRLHRTRTVGVAVAKIFVTGHQTFH
jgi:hypothetical protein